MKKTHVTMAVAATCATIGLTTQAQAVTLPSAAAAFDIQLSASGLSASQSTIFDNAVTWWETLIAGYIYDISGVSSFDNTLNITATIEAIDGVGGVLGSAGPGGYYYQPGAVSPFAYASTGSMRFDSADISNMESNGSLFEVIVHEIAHVIGIGTLWDVVGAYDQANAPGEYVGAWGLLGYQAECDAGASFVPVELDGGAGTAHGHWDETWSCTDGNQALMTGYINSPTFLSMATVGSLIDLGYAINVTAVPLPAGGALALSGFGVLGLMARRRRKSAA